MSSMSSIDQSNDDILFLRSLESISLNSSSTDFTNLSICVIFLVHLPKGLISDKYFLISISE